MAADAFTAKTAAHGMVAQCVTGAKASRTWTIPAKDWNSQAVLGNNSKLCWAKVKPKSFQWGYVEPVADMGKGERHEPGHLPLVFISKALQQLLMQMEVDF